MQNNINTLLIFIISFQLILNISFIFIWKLPFLRKYHSVYSAEQKIHNGFVPRLGGLTLILTLGIVHIFSILPAIWKFTFPNLFLSLFPLIFITFLEDTYNNILPQARLFFIFVSSILVFIFMSFKLPVIDIPMISNLFIDHPWLLIIFLIIAMVGMVNAFNFIDGVNGLLLFNFISIFYCLKLMAIEVNDFEWVGLLNILIILSLTQLTFNFPKAFIFAGDLGAYSFGMMISVLVIIFFGQYPEFLTWQASLILFYPSCELLFTIIRRFLSKKNPFNADRLHLHQLIFDTLENWSGKILLSNYLSTILLLPIWGLPLFWIYTFGPHLNLLYTLLGLGLNFILYITYYFYFTKVRKH